MTTDFKPGDLAMCIRDVAWDDVTPLPGLQLMNVYKVNDVLFSEYFCLTCLCYHSQLEIRIDGPRPPPLYWGWDSDFFKKVDPLPPEELELHTDIPIHAPSPFAPVKSPEPAC